MGMKPSAMGASPTSMGYNTSLMGTISMLPFFPEEEFKIVVEEHSLTQDEDIV